MISKSRTPKSSKSKNIYEQEVFKYGNSAGDAIKSEEWEGHIFFEIVRLPENSRK